MRTDLPASPARLFGRAGESVTRSDRRQREPWFGSSLPPLTARPNRRRDDIITLRVEASSLRGAPDGGKTGGQNLAPVGHPFITDTERRFAPISVRQDYTGVRYGLEQVSDIVRIRTSAGVEGYAQNRITFRPHFYFGDTNKEIDFVFFLNGLPIVDLELKHEANQNVHDAVAQFAGRDHALKIFQHPFLYLAADTCDVKAATDPRREENFRWHDTGLTNTPTNPDEYPVEFLYRKVLSKKQLLEALSFFLVRVPHRDAEDDKPERPAFTLFPRYHQSRLVRKISADITAHFAAHGDIGKKYLADPSAGSGKTLSICWLADHLHSLFKPGTNEKLVDITTAWTGPSTAGARRRPRPTCA